MSKDTQASFSVDIPKVWGYISLPKWVVTKLMKSIRSDNWEVRMVVTKSMNGVPRSDDQTNIECMANYSESECILIRCLILHISQ